MQGHFDEARQLLRARAADLPGVWARAVRQRRVAARRHGRARRRRLRGRGTPPRRRRRRVERDGRDRLPVDEPRTSLATRSTASAVTTKRKRLRARASERPKRATSPQRRAGGRYAHACWLAVASWTRRFRSPARPSPGARRPTRCHRSATSTRLTPRCSSWQAGTRRPSLRWNMRSTSTSARDTARTPNGRERRSPSSSTTSSASTSRSARAPFLDSDRARASCFIASRSSSRCSLRQLSNRSTSSVPFASAARTAQPGSRPCAQSAKRHSAGERLEILEGGLHARVGIPELELAHARCIEHEPALGKRHELAVRRRVPAAAVLADLAHGEQLRADERVHERRLADARRAEQRRRPSRRDVRAHRVDAVAVRRADGWTGTPNATDSTSYTRDSTSSQRSAFVSSTTGWAPLSQASVR